MGGKSATRGTGASGGDVTPSWVSVLCGWTLCVLLVSADLVVHQRDTNDTITNTRSLSITDVCPGVEYLINQNNTNTTFLPVNVTSCWNGMVNPTAHQGVVYGVCADVNVFCVLRLVPPHGMPVLASMQRLEYWCSTRHWRTGVLRYKRHRWSADVELECGYHSLEEIFVGFGESTLMEHVNSPQINITIKTVQYFNFVVKHTKEYSGYVIAPSVDDRFVVRGFIAEWKVASGKTIMVSVQQTKEFKTCFRPLIKFTFSKASVGQSSVYTMHLCETTVTIINTSILKIEVKDGFGQQTDSFLKMYLSALSLQGQHAELHGGLFNCSVADYSDLQHHLDCNLKPECEDGRDETEHCAFSSPQCQGLVASHNKCFIPVYIQTYIHPALMQYECERIGGRPASLKTRREQVDFSHLFKNYFKFEVIVGCESGWYSRQFLYSMFQKWSDKTLIYNLNHFMVGRQYSPSRRVWFTEIYSMAFRHTTFRSKKIVCEVNLQPGVFSLNTSLDISRVIKCAPPETQQKLSVCQESYITHAFLSCESNCIQATHSKQHEFRNLSDTHYTDISVFENRLHCSENVFRCDDDTTKVHHTLVCDFAQDCSDGSDELFCKYPSCSGFFCSNGQCVLSSQRCNQYSDCLDDSDEAQCSGDSTYLPQLKNGGRYQWVYVNLDGTGYFTQQDMSADQSCPDSHYQCKVESLYCLPVYTRCNGFSDCVYGEDEQGCDTVVCPGFYQCRSSRICVHGVHLCDGWGQCPQRDDELMCDSTCPEGCLCQGHSFLCNIPFSSHLYPLLRYLDATGSNMALRDFNTNIYLVQLTLSSCSLHNVSHIQLPNLKYVDLSNNHLRTFNLTVFLELLHLQTLYLKDNPLSKIASEETHHIHHELRKLDVSKTHLNILSRNVSLYLPGGKFLNVSFCPIKTIGVRGLKNVPHLEELDIQESPLSGFPLDLFFKSHHLQRIFASNFRVCCKNLLPKHSRKIKCFTSKVVLPSCTMLLPTELCQVFFWMCSIVALIGNSICIAVSSIVTKVLGGDFVKSISHLLIANICMGSHVSVTVVANHVFYGTYLQFERTWTNSVLCKLAGFLSFLASNISVFFIWLFTMHHFVVFCLPAQSWRCGQDLAPIVWVIMWVVGLLMATIPFLPGLSHWGLQGQSGLCRLALFQHGPYEQNFRWFTVTEAVNCSLCVMIIASQAAIYRLTPKYRIALFSTQRSVLSAVHAMRKLAVTEAVCWILFELATVIRSHGVVAFDQIHDTLVVFVLPFNSALHPLLYLWTARTQWQQQQQEKRMAEILKLRLAHAK